MEEDNEKPRDQSEFSSERKRARFFFNLTSILYPLIEWHLFPRYEKALEKLRLPAKHTVLDVATGSGILAAAFARRGHRVSGFDFSEKLLKRAKRKFPGIDFKIFDLVELNHYPSASFDIVSTGYLLHGLSTPFREKMLRDMARISSGFVVIFDYHGNGGWLVRLIERIEGPHYPHFLSTSREAEFDAAGLKIRQSFLTSPFGRVWLCEKKELISGVPDRMCL